MNALGFIIVPFLIKTLIDIGEWISEGFSPNSDRSIAVKRIASLVLGVLGAFALNVDAFTVIGITMTVPFVGLILTGLMFGRGGNVINDFLANRIGVTK